MGSGWDNWPEEKVSQYREWMSAFPLWAVARNRNLTTAIYSTLKQSEVKQPA